MLYLLCVYSTSGNLTSDISISTKMDMNHYKIDTTKIYKAIQFIIAMVIYANIRNIPSEYLRNGTDVGRFECLHKIKLDSIIVRHGRHTIKSEPITTSIV